MVAPAVIITAALVIYPLGKGFQTSLESGDAALGGQPHFVGLRNYRDVLNSSTARDAIVHTLSYVALAVTLELALGLIVAVVLLVLYVASYGATLSRPLRRGGPVVRAGYGIFYDGYTNGVGGPLQAAVSALPWTEAYQLQGPGLNFADPYNGQTAPFVTQQFVRPATVLTIQSGMLPPYSQNWDFSVERVIRSSYLLDVRYVGNKGTHLPRFIEANPAVYGPGATTGNADQRREYADCPAALGSCAFASVGLIADNNSSTYQALQVAFSRQFTGRFSFLASYWWSKSLDYVSSLNLSGSAPTLVAGENDLAQNPFDLKAEHGHHCSMPLIGSCSAERTFCPAGTLHPALSASL